MDTKSISNILQPDDPAYERCWQRLKEDLGMDDEAVEVILNLRNQVIVLQARLRKLESTIEVYETSYGSRMTTYRQVSYDADWEDIE